MLAMRTSLARIVAYGGCERKDLPFCQAGKLPSCQAKRELASASPVFSEVRVLESGVHSWRGMEMFLMALTLSVLGLAVTAMAFGAATRPERTQAAPAPQPHVAKPQARLFVEPGIPIARPRVPIEALLLEIENHVRLEQAAAESFVEFPTAALLHSKTSSTFVN
jgi:hypothetical protein